MDGRKKYFVLPINWIGIGHPVDLLVWIFIKKIVHGHVFGTIWSGSSEEIIEELNRHREVIEIYQTGNYTCNWIM